MRRLRDGELLTREDREEVATNYYVSDHAKEQLKKRGVDLDEVEDLIRFPFFAYKNTDDTINFVRTKTEYLVAHYHPNLKKYCIVTYKEASKNGFTTLDKWELAKKHKKRNPK